MALIPELTETIKQTPHRRFNPLTGEWILVSPHRLQRPWQGKVERVETEQRPQHDPQCYLCPGNSRAGGVNNPNYDSTFVFPNDFPALLASTPGITPPEGELFRIEAASGICRVVCFSPRHDLTLAQMEAAQIAKVVDVWAEQFTELSGMPDINYVQIFENKGALMGCSNPHPHGQIWASSMIPTEIQQEGSRQLEYFQAHGSTMLTDIEAAERRAGDRVVCANEDWLAVVPFWAKWPFETLVMPREPWPDLPAVPWPVRQTLAAMINELTIRYDNLFATSFPYTMGFHQAPVGQTGEGHWVLHMHFYPPLLRSATVQKFMVGFEMLCEAQRDITPEQAAERLRQVSGSARFA